VTPGPGQVSQAPPAHPDSDADRWREAARLRSEFRGWIVIWLAPESQFRAYRRLPGARRDTALSAATPAGLAVQISQAGQATGTPAGRRAGHG
jgi:hypothetical protein